MAGITLLRDPLGVYRLPKEEQLVMLGMLEAMAPERDDDPPVRLPPQSPDEMAAVLDRMQSFVDGLPG